MDKQHSGDSMISKSANELELYRECFGHLYEENNVFSQVLHILEVVANSHTGLGEVMQDYAKQAYGQLQDILKAGRNILNARQSEEDLEILHNATGVIRTVSKFLELTPGAMRRNKAETIGRLEKISSADVERIYRVFTSSIETKLLLAYETEDKIAV